MASPYSQGNTPLGHVPQDAQAHGAHAPTVVAPTQGQNWNLESIFTASYSIFTSVLTYLNRLDVKNLQLAGLRTPISREVRRKYLIPSQCDEVLHIPGVNPTKCTNTTQNVDEIRTCHGWQKDGWDLISPQERWIEPPELYKHPHDSEDIVRATGNDEGGYFDSFNVCIHCFNRDRERRRRWEDRGIRIFHSTLCLEHCLEHIGQRPYNTCRCKMFLAKYWRCHDCATDTFAQLQDRSYMYGETFGKTVGKSRQLNGSISTICPLDGCTNKPWHSGPSDMLMALCRGCTAIIPRMPQPDVCG